MNTDEHGFYRRKRREQRGQNVYTNYTNFLAANERGFGIGGAKKGIFQPRMDTNKHEF
jgi:hypothetical protein